VVLQTASGCNTHAFTAASSCAVLDLLPPPYNPRDRARPTSGPPHVILLGTAWLRCTAIT